MTLFAIRIVLVFPAINVCITQQVEFVLAFTQYNIEFDMCMDIPQGIKTKGGSRIKLVLGILKKLYGQSQGFRVWKQHLSKVLEEIVFRYSSV